VQDFDLVLGERREMGETAKRRNGEMGEKGRSKRVKERKGKWVNGDKG
jgi:hypothetical protein